MTEDIWKNRVKYGNSTLSPHQGWIIPSFKIRKLFEGPSIYCVQTREPGSMRHRESPSQRREESNELIGDSSAQTWRTAIANEVMATHMTHVDRRIQKKGRGEKRRTIQKPMRNQAHEPGKWPWQKLTRLLSRISALWSSLPPTSLCGFRRKPLTTWVPFSFGLSLDLTLNICDVDQDGWKHNHFNCSR